MRNPNPADIVSVGEKFGLQLSESDANRLISTIESFLESREAISEMSLYKKLGPEKGRGWSEPNPETNPYNAIITECNIHSPSINDGPLSGLDVGVKDIISVKGVPLTAGSEVLHGFIPQSDATVVDRLISAGANISAKTNLDEFSVCARGTTSYMGDIKNPHDVDHTAGGSSGGSAVAVASKSVDIALGTDTGGSIRIPASFCGVLGLKPTYGLISLYGVIENTHTHDTVGPMARNLMNIGLTLDTIAGEDQRDPTTLQAAGINRDNPKYVESIRDPAEMTSLSIGILEQGFGDHVASTTANRVMDFCDNAEENGIKMKFVSVPSFHYSKSILDIITCVEVADHWRAGGATYRHGGDVDEGYQIGLARRTQNSDNALGDFMKSKILAGAEMIESDRGRYYSRANRAKKRLISEFNDVFSEVDGIVLPTTPSIAPKITDVENPGFAFAHNTRPANVANLPALSLPIGTSDDLPIGLQIMTESYNENKLLSIASNFQSLIPDGTLDN